MKLLTVLFLLFMFCENSQAAIIKMFGKEECGFDQPRYITRKEEAKYKIEIKAIAEDDNFPISSSLQGSVFDKIFEDVYKKTRVKLTLNYSSKYYDELVRLFERGENLQEINAIFGVYFRQIPYSNNTYIYPAFFYNNLYLITSQYNKISITKKEDMKKYKGVHIANEKVSEVVEKEYKALGIESSENLNKAYELLLTGEVDYIIAGYYSSTIGAYKLGIRDYLSYSKEPIWKMPMFIRVSPYLKRNPLMKNLEKYLGSDQYKKVREEAFEELIEIYKTNTQGVVPPIYIKNDGNNEITEE